MSKPDKITIELTLAEVAVLLRLIGDRCNGLDRHRKFGTPKVRAERRAKLNAGQELWSKLNTALAAILAREAA